MCGLIEQVDDGVEEIMAEIEANIINPLTHRIKDQEEWITSLLTKIDSLEEALEVMYQKHGYYK